MLISYLQRHRAQLYNRHLPAMSAQGRKKVVVGAVARRREDEVVAEMAEIAKGEKARMAAQAAQALPKPLHLERIEWSRLRPVRWRRPINPIPPPSPEEVVAAAVKRRELEEGEAYLLEEADRLASRPRSPTPPRAKDDHYDLARWSFRRGF